MSPLAGGRDWAEIPLDMLGSVAELLGAADFIRFGAVCSTWASVGDDGAVSLRQGPQMPYLLHLTDDDEGDGVLVSFPDKRCHRISGVPQLRGGKWLVGSQDGWIALLDERSEVSLLNPLTRAQIHLPSITTIPQFKPIKDPGNPPGEISWYIFKEFITGRVTPVTIQEVRVMSFKKVVFSSKPIAGGTTPTAMAIFHGYRLPAIAIAGEGKWTCFPECPVMDDIIYRDGKFLAVTNKGELWTFEEVNGTSSPKVAKIAEGFMYSSYFLVDSSDGLLMVEDGTTGETIKFKVSKFNAEQGSWFTLKTLGDNSLFLGICNSISVSAREIPDLRPNCIYYTEILWDWAHEDVDRYATRQVFVFNLEDESVDYYIPSDPRFNWPPPLWVAPSLL